MKHICRINKLITLLSNSSLLGVFKSKDNIYNFISWSKNRNEFLLAILYRLNSNSLLLYCLNIMSSAQHKTFLNIIKYLVFVSKIMIVFCCRLWQYPLLIIICLLLMSTYSTFCSSVFSFSVFILFWKLRTINFSNIVLVSTRDDIAAFLPNISSSIITFYRGFQFFGNCIFYNFYNIDQY